MNLHYSTAAMAVAKPATHEKSIEEAAGEEVRLTNLDDVFWPDPGLTKGDLLQYFSTSSSIFRRLQGPAAPQTGELAEVCKSFRTTGGGPDGIMAKRVAALYDDE